MQDFFCPECSRFVKARNVTDQYEKRNGYLYPQEDMAIIEKQGYALLLPLTHRTIEGHPSLSSVCSGSRTLYFAGDGSL